MDIVSIGIGIGAGTGIGLAIGAAVMHVIGKSKHNKIYQALETLRSESSKQIAQLKANQGDLMQQLEGTKAKAQHAEQSLGQLKAESSKVRAALKDAEAAAHNASAYQQASSQAEARARQAEHLANEHASRASQLESNLQQYYQQLQQSQALIQERDQEVMRLRAASGSTGTASLEEAMATFAQANGALDQILNILVQTQGQTAAVLADSNGIVVASAGDHALRDGVAAVAQLITRLDSQFQGMIPFSVVRAFDLKDSDQNVFAGRAAAISGETIAVATYGQHVPDPSMLDGAIAALSAALA